MYNIDPDDCPLVDLARVGTAKAIFHSWPEDTLPAAVTSGHTEGGDFEQDNLPMPSRLTNTCQIFRRDIKISLTQIALDPAGIDDQYMYQIEKCLTVNKISMEKRAWEGGALTAEVTGSGSDDVRKMKTMDAFITDNAFHCDASDLGGNGSAGGATADEDIYNALLQKIYEDGGKPRHTFLSPQHKRQFSTFTGVSYARATIALSDRTVYDAVDVYVSNFGKMFFVLDRHVPSDIDGAPDDDGTSCAYVLDMTRIAFAHLPNRRQRHYPLPPQGDSVIGYVAGECTLQVANDKGHGRLYGIEDM